MTTLKETVIELGDRHTTLYYFDKPKSAPLPFADAGEYRQLHKTLAAPKRTEYSDVHPGGKGAILGKLAPAYGTYKYWPRHLSSNDYSSYPDRAWDYLLPIKSTLTTRIEWALGAEFTFLVRPVPTVLLYPFGWSTRINLLITGSHVVADLVALLQRLLTAKVFTLDQGPSPLSLSEFFSHVAEGVRTDAFGGKATKDTESSDPFIVTTVMVKHGGSAAIAALSAEGRNQMLRLVRPDGPLPGHPFKEHVFQFPAPNALDYIVFDDLSRFNWMEHLLKPEGRNHNWLECYHNNSFLSMVQADHYRALLEEAGKRKSLPESLYWVARSAARYLESPGYKNASLVAFLKDPTINNTLAIASGFKPEALDG